MIIIIININESITSSLWLKLLQFKSICVELGKMPVETKKLLEMTKAGSRVSRALVYRWHKRFSDGRSSCDDEKRCGRPSIVDDSRVMLNVRHVIQENGRHTVREISIICDIGKTTVYKIIASTVRYPKGREQS